MKLHFVLLLLIVNNSFGQNTGELQKIKEAKLTFEIPNKEWSFIGKKEVPFINFVAYNFTRKPLTNSQNISVSGFISAIVQDIENNEDVVSWSISRNKQLKVTVTDVLTYNNGNLSINDAIGYKAIYLDKDEISHTYFLIYIKNKSKGTQLILDITSDLFDLVEKEFLQVIMSIKK